MYDQIISNVKSEEWLVREYKEISISETVEDNTAFAEIKFNNSNENNILAICKNPRSENKNNESQREAVLGRKGIKPLDPTRQRIIDYLNKDSIKNLYIVDAVPVRTFNSDDLDIGNIDSKILDENFDFIEDLIEEKKIKKILLLTGDLYKKKSDKDSYQKALTILQRLDNIIEENRLKIYILSITNKGFPSAINSHRKNQELSLITETDISKIKSAIHNK